jgi:cation diffusion facilitator family transporter
MSKPPTPASAAAGDYHAQVRRVLWITLALNLVVVAIKLVVGVWTASLSLLADALHSITDSVNNVMGLFVSRVAAAAPDEEHPYGHQKFEAVGALGIASFLGIACFEIVRGAAGRLFGAPGHVRIAGTELALLLLVLAVNIFVAVYERRVGRRINSPILQADANHTLSDIWVTLGVLGGLAGIWLWDLQWLDVALSVPVALLVLWTGWVVVRQNLPWLVDATAVAPEAVRAVAASVPGVLDCHAITSRGVVGRQVFIEMHLVTGAPDVETSHQITEEIERRLDERYGPAQITIHVEPPDYAEPPPGPHRVR